MNRFMLTAYAKVQNEGGRDTPKKIHGKYVRSDVKTVMFGGGVTARPFMTPSRHVLRLPYSLLVARIKKLGW